MKEVEIRLSLAENVKSFVNIVSRFDYEMDLQSGRHVVDAKSSSSFTATTARIFSRP